MRPVYWDLCYEKNPGINKINDQNDNIKKDKDCKANNQKKRKASQNFHISCFCESVHFNCQWKKIKRDGE